MTEKANKPVFPANILYTVDGEPCWMYPTKAARLRGEGKAVFRAGVQPIGGNTTEQKRQDEGLRRMQESGTNGRGAKD